MINQRFGRLTVAASAEPDFTVGGRPMKRWLCRCDCGTEKVLRQQDFQSGNTRSCGCLGVESRYKNIKHGHGSRQKVSKTYATWSWMLARCTNPSVKSWKHYGGRGITTCDRWRSFENFLADMGEKPSGLSLDRIDVNGNYEPGNCRWATKREQSRNTRTNHFVTLGGATVTIADAAEAAGLPYWKVQQRVYRGWSIERAITE